MSRMKIAVGVTWVFLAACAMVSSARAEGGDVTVPTARETEIDLNFDTLYDSNIARSDRVLAAKRGLTLADELFTPGVSATLARPIGRAMIFINTVDTYEFHRVNTVRNRPSIDVNGGIAAHIGPCQEVLSDEYTRTQIDLSELSLGVVTNSPQHETVKFAANCGRAIGFAPSATVAQSWLTNSAPLLRQVDNRSLTATAAMGYQQPALGVVSIFGEFTEATLPNRLLPSIHGPMAYGYDVYASGVRFVRPVGSRIEATLSVSYTELDPNSPISKPFSGLTYSLDGTYHVSSRLAAHVLASRATVPSNRINANYSIDETYEADLAYQLGTRLTLRLTGTRMSANYEGLNISSAQDLTKSTIDSILAEATFNMSRRLSFTFSVGDEERSANFPGLSYSSTRVGLSTKVTF